MKKILYAGSEVMPFAATGGLGDVLGSLPAAVKQKNPECDVRVVMPYYGQIKPEWREQMVFVKHMRVPLAWRKLACSIYTLEKDGVIFYFLENKKIDCAFAQSILLLPLSQLPFLSLGETASSLLLPKAKHNDTDKISLFYYLL